MPALAPGTILERYEIVRLVGRGGMGEVYHATDTRLRRAVALKVLRDDRDQSAETGIGGAARLLREARAAAALNHPNSVGVYELGEYDGVAYIAMELVKGESFKRHSQNPQLSVETKLTWLIDAARALWAAHKAGIIHRDIKPTNIMVSEEGIVKVLDFGLAKPHQLMNEPGFQTVMGQVLGTPRYMAPEQLEGAKCDERADQYGFGCTAYELLCGEYAGGPLAGSIKPMREISVAIPAELDQIVLRMLAKNAADRFASMEEVAHGLSRCMPVIQAFRLPRTSAMTPDGETTKDMLPSDVLPTSRTLTVPTAAVEEPISKERPSSDFNVTVRLTPTGTAIADPILSKAPSSGTLPLGTKANKPIPPAPASNPVSSGGVPATAPMMTPLTPMSVTTTPASRPSADPAAASGQHRASASQVLRPGGPMLDPRPGKTSWILVSVIVGLVALVLGSALAYWLR